MGCFMQCRKWTVLIFNLLFLFIGIGLIVVGVLSLHNMNELSKVIPSSYHYLSSTPIILLVLGSIIFLVSILGTLGAFKNNPFLLNTYTIILLIIFVLQIVLSIISFWAVSNQKDLAVTVNATVKEIFEKDSNSTDFIQTKLECCGTSGPEYWKSISQSAPKSCYENKNIYKKGCQNASYDFLLLIIRITGMATLAVSPFQVIGATVSLSLVNAIRSYWRVYGKYVK